MAQEVHHHTFKPVEPPTNVIISTTFTIAIAVLFVALIVGLMKTIVCKNLKIRFASLFAISGLAASLAFVGYFWVKLTLMQVVGVFFFAFVPITCLCAYIGGKFE